MPTEPATPTEPAAPAAPAADAPVDWQAKAAAAEARATALETKTAKQLADLSKKLEASQKQIDDPKFQRSIAAKLLGSNPDEDPAVVARQHQEAAQKYQGEANTWRSKALGVSQRQFAQAALLKVPGFNAETMDDALGSFLNSGPVELDEETLTARDMNDLVAKAADFVKARKHFQVSAAAPSAAAPGAPTPSARPPMPPHPGPAAPTSRPAMTATQLWNAPRKEALAARDAVLDQHGIKH